MIMIIRIILIKTCYQAAAFEKKKKKPDSVTSLAQQ